MVYNLAFEAKEIDITKIAKQFGTVEDFQMPFISKKKNKGYCLVTFAKEKEANFFVESVNFLKKFFLMELESRNDPVRSGAEIQTAAFCDQYDL